ncbi:MAG: UDP-N-acetylmuramate dehydrogenase [Bdellovibrionota bacterium]
MDSIFKKLSGRIESNKDLSQVVAYKIGGNARYFYTPTDSADLLELLDIAEKQSIPLFILGSGTNLLVSDKGFDGLILWMGPKLSDSRNDVQVLSEDDTSVYVKVPAHFSKAKLLDIAIGNSWGALEFSAGIPGSLGGAVFMNAGTKWGSYGDVIQDVEFVSLKKGTYSLKCEDIGFKYRGMGEGLLDGKTIVSTVTLKLAKNTPQSEILKKVDEIYSYRGLRQPLELPNCGSVFKNPANSEKGAGRLIEAAKLKGTVHGGAEISLKHANFILNKGNAKASDVLSLIQKVQDVVEAQFQVKLETEVICLGF